jgi:two-component system sensor histidine kinase TctE
VVEGGTHLAGQRNIPTQGSGETRYRGGRAFDAHYDGQPVRVAAVRVGTDTLGADVLVAETLIKRQRTQQELLWALLPLLALLIATAAAIELAVRRTLKPLATMAASWNAQSHASLAPIASHDVPRELLPFAQALNDLLSRMRGVLDRERQFAATAAHQLRTPLAGLQLGLSRVADAPDIASARAVLAELGATTQRTARLVQQLLALSRLDPEARGDLGFVAADLVALSHDVGASVMDAALAKEIDLEMVAPALPIVVHMHPELMTEALGNLLDNALRYTPRGGRVLIEFEREPPTVRISDSGPGVTPAERQAVFERFVRGLGAKGDGSGLGLAIVREIATLHGATVAMTESAAGGACVTIRFAPRSAP